MSSCLWRWSKDEAVHRAWLWMHPWGICQVSIPSLRVGSSPGVWMRTGVTATGKTFLGHRVWKLLHPRMEASCVAPMFSACYPCCVVTWAGISNVLALSAGAHVCNLVDCRAVKPDWATWFVAGGAPDATAGVQMGGGVLLVSKSAFP